MSIRIHRCFSNIINTFHIGNGVYVALVMIFSSCFLWSCSESDDPEPEPTKLKKTILIYAIASNNLYSNLLDDKREILQAVENKNLDDVSIMFYHVTPYDAPGLYEVSTNKTGEKEWSLIKQYDKSLYSTDPQRISEVVNEVLSTRDSNQFGLVFWGHGTGIDPFSSVRTLKSATNGSLDSAPVSELYSFGCDKDSDKNSSYSDWTNIDELADAVPDGVFDFIWFDVCYMSGIETMYQFRNKCNYFVGYVTEVYEDGMPYHLTMPYILADKTDLNGAADAFFKYYIDKSSIPATISVVKMSEIGKIAAVCREAYKGYPVVSSSNLQEYTRNGIGPFYDFGQYTWTCAPDIKSDIKDVLDDFVVYKKATSRGFNNKVIAEENYSGISCFLFSPTATDAKNTYYKKLDWYKAVYE